MKLKVHNNEVKLSNLDKIFWPEKGYTKKDLINYYIEIYPEINNYLKNRPLALKVYPDGIKGKSFYQKNCPDHAPDWLSTVSLFSRHNQKSINWITVNKLSDLIWVANRASIELHGWFSTIKHPDSPDFAVFDLDPTPEGSFQDAVKVALLLKKTLDELNLESFVKTSGKRGLHIFIPLNPIYEYSQIRKFLKTISCVLLKLKPDLVTINWRKQKRKGKIYIDYRQNGRSKTIPAPYSLRPTPGATVSAPLNWSELNSRLNPENFTIASITSRLKKNLWQDILILNQKLPDHFTNIFLFFFLFSCFYSSF